MDDVRWGDFVEEGNGQSARKRKGGEMVTGEEEVKLLDGTRLVEVGEREGYETCENGLRYNFVSQMII